MKRKLYITLIALSIAAVTGCGNSSNNNSSDLSDSTSSADFISDQKDTVTLLKSEDTLSDQARIDDQLATELNRGYSIEEPLVVLNPYGNAPLSAIALFTTPTEQEVTLVVKGHDSKDDITAKFEASKDHVIPIYGLYANGVTEVEFTLGDGNTKTVEVTTADVPEKYIKAEVTTIDESVYDYSQLTFGSSGADNCHFAYDSKGDLRWFLDGLYLPLKRLANGNFISAGSILVEPNYYRNGVAEFDMTGKIYNEYSVSGGMHHAIFELSNGNLLLGSSSEDFSYVEDRIVEVDRKSGEVVWELQMADLIDRTEGGSINRSDHDWFHNNAIWYNEETDLLYISGRHVDAVVCVKKSDQSLQYILGNPEGWSEKYQKYFLTPIADTDSFEWQYAQHQIVQNPNGDLMLFDNGAGRTKSTAKEKEVTGDDVYSRMVIYRVDQENMTVEQVFEYGKERGASWYSSFISGNVYEADGNYWITSGGILYDPAKNTFGLTPYAQFNEGIERSAYIDHVIDGELVYELKIPELTFRTARFTAYAKQNRNGDFSTKGQWIGHMGKTEEVSTEIITENAQPMNSEWKLQQNPVCLIFSGTGSIASADVLQEGFFVLKEENGIQHIYPLSQTTAEAEDGTCNVTFRKWVTPVGLEGKTYHAYVVFDGITYDTGYQVAL